VLNILEDIPVTPQPEIAERVKARWDSLTKPRGSLGRLEMDVIKLAQIQGTAMPRVDRRGMYVFCGDHGVTAEGVSLYPSVVTREMVKNFVRGGAAINVLCKQLEIETFIVDAGVGGPKIDGTLDRRIAEGTNNFHNGPAMSGEQARAAIESGIDLAQDAAGRFDLVGVGEMGIGNSTSASALLCVLADVSPMDAVGRGTGLDDDGVRHKREILTAALAAHQLAKTDPLSVVAAFGGFEIAMMAGFLLGAAARQLAVVVDGFISGSAVLVARAFYSDIGSHIFFAHRSAEPGHAHLLASAGAQPLLDLGLCLGEGTGAALAMGVLTSAVRLYREMATFAEASVSDAENTVKHIKERTA
jgi:nicotinate-nucleotide--dimethylbenzimidazole phosphoribosyltransferase